MVIKKLLTSAKNSFLELLLPTRCVVCEKVPIRTTKNKLICTECLKSLTPSTSFYCPLCEAKSIDGGLCFSCQLISGNDAKFRLDKLFAPFSYKEIAVQKLIKALKYKFIKDLDEPIGRLMKTYLEKIGERINLSGYLVIPVPLHKRKFNQRGYNQAELIAGKIAENLNLEMVKDCLTKNRMTKDQANLKEAERIKNLNGAFEIIKPGLVSGRKVMLIDDVYTTGTTMNECARVLKEAGTKEVVGLVIARG